MPYESKKTKKHNEKQAEIEKYVKKYNDSMKHFNIDSNISESYVNELVGEGVGLNLTLHSLDKILWYLKANVSKSAPESDYILENITKYPLLFVEKNLITIRTALKIIDRFRLYSKIDRKTLCKCIITCIVIESPEIYFEKSNFRKEYNYLFNSGRNVLYKDILAKCKIDWGYIHKSNIIDKIGIDRMFENNTRYYTLKNLEDLQKNCGDLLLSLYNDDDDDDDSLDDDSLDDDDDINDSLDDDDYDSLDDDDDINDSLDDDDYDEEYIERFIDNYTTKKRDKIPQFEFNKEQHQAIIHLIQNRFSILTGLPGTGKTEVIDCVVQYMETKLNYKNICLTAPTGLATKNLVARCKIDKNSNICVNSFKLIKNTFPKIKESMDANSDSSMHNKDFERYTDELAKETDFNKRLLIMNEQDKLTFYKNKPDIIILDEASMITLPNFYELLTYCKSFKCKLILLGDPNQLPSIGKGQPFIDIIDSEIFTVNKLTTIMRNNGKLKETILSICNGNECIIQEDTTISWKPLKEIATIDTEDKLYDMLEPFIQTNKLDKLNTKFISPCRKGLFGIDTLNKVLQNIYNLEGDDIAIQYRKYRVGDIIIRTKNSYNDDGCFANGDTATIKNVETNHNDEITIIIEYDTPDEEPHNSKEHKISPSTLNEEFELAYALTIHKTQGSGYDNTVLLLDSHSSHNFMWNKPDAKKLFYTGISRAKQKCYLFYEDTILKNINTKSLDFKSKTIFMTEFNDYEI